MYERFISSSMLTGNLFSEMSVIGQNESRADDHAAPTRACTRLARRTAGLVRSGAPARPARASAVAHRSDVEVLDVERVVFDELAARFHLVPHEGREHEVRFHVILGAH